MNWKKTIGLFAVAGLFMGASFNFTANNVVEANTQIDHKENKIKFFVGQSLSPDIDDKAKYKEVRKQLLKDQAKAKPENQTRALITFDSYLSLDDAQNFVNNHPGMKVEVLWFSIPNQTGRGAAFVKNNNLKKAMQEFVATAKQPAEKNDVAKKDYNQIASGNVGFFAMTVVAKNKELSNLLDHHNVKFIDIHYDEQVTKKAQSEGKQVVYIDLPEKPDGTQ